MATVDDIAEIRRLVDEVGLTSTWTDLLLGGYVDAYGMNGAAARVWAEKAAQYSRLVNISESGSSRAMSQLSENALKMSKFYAAGGADLPGSDGLTTVHQLVRRTSPES